MAAEGKASAAERLKEFEDRLRASRRPTDLNAVVEQFLFQNVPVFFDDVRAYNRLRQAVAQDLSVSTEDVVVVGSAQTGFSLDPYKYPTAFGPHSDVDVVVVSEEWFHVSWIDVLTLRLVPWSRLSQRVRRYVDEHRERHYVYRGWIWPDNITPSLTIGQKWFECFHSLPTRMGAPERKFNGRLFKSWEHAREYYKHSLELIRRKLMGG